MNAQEIITTLGLQPHPEGGCYIQTFRDADGPSSDGDARGHSTAIYYLLKAGERSHWHRVKDAAEVWHFHAGSPLKLRLAKENEVAREIILGIDLRNGERPQAVVVADEWQCAESLGEFTLVGCTVAPGFEFSKFEMAPPGWEPGN